MSQITESVMLKQSPSRNQRSKGFKVKHALHICLLLAICIWLLYQVKQTYGKKAALGDTSRKIEKFHGILKLGRKGLDPQMEEIAAEFKKHEDEEDELEQDDEEEKLRENEGEQRGVGDDEIDGHDQEKAEDEEEPDQLEDLIDEGDKEKEEDGEGKGSVEMDSFGEDVGLINNQHRIGVRRNSEEGKEERYRGDIDIKHNTQLISEKESGILRAVKEEEQVTNAAKNEVDGEDKNRT